MSASRDGIRFEMIVRSVAAVAFAGGVGALVAAAPQPATDPPPLRARHLPDLSSLVPGISIERHLGAADDHRYQLTLGIGEYVRVVVEQRGIDVSVETRGADGAPIAEFDADPRPSGTELVDLVGTTSGLYTLIVHPPRGNAAPGAYAIRVEMQQPATAVERSVQLSRTLRMNATRAEREGWFEEARPLLERALTIIANASGRDSIETAEVEVQLAGVYSHMPDARKSEALYQDAIGVYERTLGGGDPRTARARAGLAALYQRGGDRQRAEPLLRDALAVIERTLGSGHPWYVRGLITLGDLRDASGDLNDEEAVLRRGLAIVEEAGNTDSYEYAALLNNLGEVYRQEEAYGAAEDLFRHALALGERLLGPDNYFVATPLQNLGIVARELKDYAAAVAYNERALAIRERHVGAHHPDIAHVLTNLANIYRALGDYPRALDTHLRALRIWESAAGPYQDATLLSVGNIAKTYAAEGDLVHAIEYQRRSDEILEAQLALNLAVGSERQKLAFVSSVAERTDRTISLHLDQAPQDANAAALAALVLLQRKGRVQDAIADTFLAVRDRLGDGRDQALLDRLEATRSELARTALAAPSSIPASERRRRLAGLEAEREQLEAALSERSAPFRAATRLVTLESVRAAIPADAALIEFAVFRPFDPKAERNSEAYGAAHYAAYVVRRDAAPVGVDLGAAAGIDVSIRALRDALRSPDANGVAARARDVAIRVIDPLASQIAGVHRLIVSPDGDLNLTPFDALVDDSGRFLIERYAITYVTSGRDLLRMEVRRESRSGPVIVADPLFGEPAGLHTEAPVRWPAHGHQHEQVGRGDFVPPMYFPPLPALAEEGRAIKALFPDASLLTGAAATKSALQRVRAPLLLHIGSHGFFLDDVAGAAALTANPLLRSGIALAGANVTRAGGPNAILTALEASGLDLWGTKLVTLSACDTGVGEIRNGEGVYGLRRAFVLAGAETLVMSLWPVSDAVARDSMVAYYTGLRAGLGRGEALRRAKLAIMSRPGRRHPYYWSAFILSGEWADLNGHR